MAPVPNVSAMPAAHPRFLIVGGTASMGIGVVRVEEDGALSAVAGSPFATGFGILSVVVAPDGRTVYVPHVGDQAVSGYRLDDNGALREIPGARIALDGPPTAAQLTPDGSHLFVVVGGVPGHVVSFAVAPSGALSPTGAPPVAVDGVSAVGMASVDPSGRYLRVATYIGNTLSSFAIGPGGILLPLGSTPVELGPVRPGYTPDGRYLYSSNEFGTDLSGFAIGADGGLIPTPGSPYPTGGVPHGALVTADGRHLYVPNAVGGSIAGFDVHSDGGLTPLPGSPYAAPAATMPGQVAVHPDGRHLYLADVLTAHGTTMVHSYLIGPDGGLVPSGQPSLDTGVVMSDGPVVAMTP
ncbi:lactonase family protein [Nocardia violaceofusca]|uniref:lactonase family protein n=1 Tax=Nocardia violaceofusca TaxID=941182 RepID=UPI0018DD6332|nr:beta-propeller fold lactonase family protein [Nocardia violaceofusca]